MKCRRMQGNVCPASLCSEREKEKEKEKERNHIAAQCDSVPGSLHAAGQVNIRRGFPAGGKIGDRIG